MVVCGDEVVVAVACNDATTNDVVPTIDVAAVDRVVVAVGARATVVVWVQK